MKVAHVLLTPDRSRAVLQGTCSRLIVPGAAKYGEHGELTAADVMQLPPAEQAKYCPRGNIGDVLWGQESWMCVAPDSGEWQWRIYSKLPAPGNIEALPSSYQSPEYCLYESTYRKDHRPGLTTNWAPAFTMPRWASRLYLKITAAELMTLDSLTPAILDETGITVEPEDANSLEAFKRSLRAAFGERFMAPTTPFWSIQFSRLDHLYAKRAFDDIDQGTPASAQMEVLSAKIKEEMKAQNLTPSSSATDSFAAMLTASASTRAATSSPSAGRHSSSGARDNTRGFSGANREFPSRAYGGYRR